MQLSHFPSSLKLADVTPLHEKERKDVKENFRPVSILANLTKMFEKCMFVQMFSFLITFFGINNWVFGKDIVLNIAF